MNNKRKFTYLSFLFTCLAVLTSCVDDLQADMNSEGEFTDGYSLQLTVTLDNFGGTSVNNTRAPGYLSSENPMKDRENYIDPEKFRVLFFNHKEEFLFESKSRWVKQLAPTDGFSQWQVSIPMYSSGNDSNYDWDWDKIREALTTNEFKIAILVNRPLEDFSPGFSESGLDGTPKWIDNAGPHWKRNHTSWGAGENDTIKTIIDLHHCQYDPLYHAKSARDNSAESLQKDNFYDFIMGDYNLDRDGKKTSSYTERYPKMGATTSFIYWGEPDGNGSIKDNYEGDSLKSFDKDFPATNKVKHTILPDKAHPIPMYGIQTFQPIKHWVEGTPFNLSKIVENQTSEEYPLKTISLLRAVVKLELCIRKDLFNNKKPPLVLLWYPNVYSRCEPMDVWTPTDQIWKDHDNGCEWKNIMEYGPVCSSVITLGNTNRNGSGDIAAFQKTMSWFYGAWNEEKPGGGARWNFERYDGSKVTIVDDKAAGVPKYPHIFNTCIQRNKSVICNKEGDVTDKYNDDYWHYVVYTGERNMIDPNKIQEMNKTAYAITWMFKDGRTGTGSSPYKNKQYYFIPIADYTPTPTGKPGNQNARNFFGPYDLTSYNLPNNNYTDAIKKTNDQKEMPWPLLRNHHYRIIIGEYTSTRAEGGISVQSEEFYSESLTPLTPN